MNFPENISFADLSEPQPHETKTPIERGDVALNVDQQQFVQDGVLTLKNFIPDSLIDAYCAEREQLPKDKGRRGNYWGGWPHPTPYLNHDKLREISLYPPLMAKLKELISEDMGLHLSLTGWVSTQRAWHQDTYLNPPPLWSYYVAVWIALDDIREDAGPFEFVRGSNNWDVTRQEKLFKYLSKEEIASPLWPTFTQDVVAKTCADEIERRGAKLEKYLPKRGDVLIWHSNLLHQGSLAENPDVLRKSLINHYSSIHRRPDMPFKKQDANGQWYFQFQEKDDDGNLIGKPLGAPRSLGQRIKARAKYMLKK